MRTVKITVIPLFVALLLFWASGCSPFHAGRTIGRGALQAEGSLGGPFVTNLGGAIPVPNLPLGLRYGATDRIDVAAHANLLPMVLGGFLALDASAVFGLVKHSGPRGWNLATGTGFLLFTDFEDSARISPIIDLAGGYTVDWFTPFVGFEMAIDFWGSNVVLNPYLGFEADIRNLTLSAACIWFYPTYDWYGSPVRYVAPDNQGAIGLIIGIKYHWDLLDLKAKKEVPR